MKAWPVAATTHKKDSLLCQKTTRPHAGVSFVRIDPLARTGTVNTLCMLTGATGHTPTTHAPPIWTNHERTNPTHEMCAPRSDPALTIPTRASASPTSRYVGGADLGASATASYATDPPMREGNRIPSCAYSNSTTGRPWTPSVVEISLP
jgi:hypothetical protein